MQKVIGIGAILVSLLLYIPAVSAQNEFEVTFGDYTVYYNTFPSTFLDKQIAKSARIKRSDSKGVVTIVAREKISGGGDKAVSASVSGTATNLIGQIRKLKFFEIRDGSAIYYLAQFTIIRGENLKFDIAISPSGAPESHEITFSRKF